MYRQREDQQRDTFITENNHRHNGDYADGRDEDYTDSDENDDSSMDERDHLHSNSEMIRENLLHSKNIVENCLATLSEDDENAKDSYDSSETDVADEEEDDKDFVTVPNAPVSRDPRLLSKN